MTEQHSSDWLGLSGRVAVVTGGGGGIGRATAVSFARAGVKVAALDRDERGLAETKAQLRAFGDGHLVASCDTPPARTMSLMPLTPSRARSVLATSSSTPRLLRPGGLDTPPLAEWNAVLAIESYRLLHLRAGVRPPDAQGWRGSLDPCRLDRRQQRAGAERRLQRQQGRGRDAVAAARCRVGPARHPQQCGQPRPRRHADGARHSTIRPGVTERRTAVVPMRRIGAPQDMADATLFLGSDRSSYVNGERSSSMAATRER